MSLDRSVASRPVRKARHLRHLFVGEPVFFSQRERELCTPVHKGFRQVSVSAEPLYSEVDLVFVEAHQHRNIAHAHAVLVERVQVLPVIPARGQGIGSARLSSVPRDVPSHLTFLNAQRIRDFSVGHTLCIKAVRLERERVDQSSQMSLHQQAQSHFF